MRKGNNIKDIGFCFDLSSFFINPGTSMRLNNFFLNVSSFLFLCFLCGCEIQTFDTYDGARQYRMSKMFDEGEKPRAEKKKVAQETVQSLRSSQRRNLDSPIRVAILSAKSSDGKLNRFLDDYEKLLRSQFASDGRFTLLDKYEVSKEMSEFHWKMDRSFMSDSQKKNAIGYTLSPELLHYLYGEGLFADVYIVPSLASKSKSGFIYDEKKPSSVLKGEVVAVQYDAFEYRLAYSSYYDFYIYKDSNSGKATGAIHLGGYNKKTKRFEQVTLPTGNNKELEGQSIESLVQRASYVIRNKIAPSLPDYQVTLAAESDMRKRLSLDNSQTVYHKKLGNQGDGASVGIDWDYFKK